MVGSIFSVLTACTAVPLPSLVKLSAVDMGTTLPSAIRVAFITPKVLRIRQGDIFMNVHLRIANGATDVRKKLDLLIDRSPPPPSLIASKTPDDDIHILKLRSEDVALFKNLQNMAAESKQAGKKGTLDISFGSNACTDAEPGGPLFLSAFIKTSELTDFTLLLNKANLNDLAKEAGQEAKVKRCEK